ncbi:unnamed protein product [Rotaria sordida]|uniref:ADP ribosyltransferase domain-containing protein n=1 Tax=Rotaria sordida TaxID=392033 RepID=A0A814ZC54_9BILA|nr:unnamed protein product [Rotaria sordida]
MGNKKSTSKKHNKSKSLSNEKVKLDDINIICLDINCNDKSSSNLKFLNELEQIVNSVQIFDDSNLCEKFLKNDFNDNEIIFFILSDKLIQQIVPRIHELIYIDSIYVFCQHKNQYDLWSNKYSKLKGHLFTEISQLCDQVKQDIRRYQNDLIPIHMLDNTFTHDQLNQIEPDFMYSQLIKETLINIKYDKNARREFIQYCFIQSNILNINQMNIIHQFENNYEKHSPIWWYTRESFVYEILNKALRTQNIDILIKMGFFIKDLHQQIEDLYSLQEHCPMIVYRGQGLTNNQFEKLCKFKGGLISFHSFLSTSLDKRISLEFARRAIEKPGLRGIIFRMKIDPKNVNLSNSYASLNNLSYYKNNEKEILFSTHTIFRIVDIKQIKDENKIWQIDLKLTTIQDDIQLEQLTKHLREDVQSLSNPWERLAKLMFTIRQFDKAQQIYENILEKTSSNDSLQLAFIYHQLGYVNNEKGNLNKALEYFQKSIEIKANYLPEHYNDPQLADTYLNIGSIYHAQDKLDYALFYFQSALYTDSNDQTILPSIYNNIGMVLKRQGHFNDALQFFQKSLQIDLKFLPPTHPDLATTYSNIGRVYYLLNDYLNALSYYKKTCYIRSLSLPQNHPSILTAIENYQNTAILFKKYNSQINLSTSIIPKTHRSCSTLSKYSKQHKKKISISKQIITNK